MIGAHPDDETFWAGGTVALHSKRIPVHVLSLTGLPPRDRELSKAMEVLGASSSIALQNDDFTINPKLRVDVIKHIQETKPNIVITHSNQDYHPDHRATHALVVDAIEWAGHRTIYPKSAWRVSELLLMEAQNLHTFPHVFVNITSVFERKKQAIEIFTSQHAKLNSYYSEFTKFKAQLRGLQSGVAYAEAFQRYPLPNNGDFYPQKSAITRLI